MASRQPAPPPSRAVRNSVRSDMRKRCFRARRLSEKKQIKPVKLISKRYTEKNSFIGALHEMIDIYPATGIIVTDFSAQEKKK